MNLLRFCVILNSNSNLDVRIFPIFLSVVGLVFVKAEQANDNNNQNGNTYSSDNKNKFVNFADTPCGVQYDQDHRYLQEQEALVLDPPPVLSPASSVLVRTRAAKIMPGYELSYPGEFPWIVSFRWNNNGAHFCAGSIISRRYILSAAHCFKKFTSSTPYPYEWMEVAIGEVNLLRFAQIKPFTVEQVWVHPWFNQSNYSNDIALVKLTEEIQWTPFQQPVCLPLPLPLGMPVESEYENYINYKNHHNHNNNNQHNLKNGPSKITIAGWGSTKMETGTTNILRKASIDAIYRNDECQNAYSYLAPRDKIEIVEEHLCAGGRSKSTSSSSIKEDSTADACYGDSGGPLMMSINSHNSPADDIIVEPKSQGDSTTNNGIIINNKLPTVTVAIGIISAGGKGCAKYPGIYARISKYIDWIQMLVPQLQPQLQPLDSGQLMTMNDNSIVISAESK